VNITLMGNLTGSCSVKKSGLDRLSMESRSCLARGIFEMDWSQWCCLWCTQL